MELSRLSYLQRGEGKDMVFLHGYLSSKECFAAQTAYFSRFCRVTAIDFPGFGGAEPLAEAFSVADYAAWTKGALSALGVERPHVVAHSFGCRVAVKLAAQDPDLFDKILLTGPAGIILRRGMGYRAKVGAYRLVKKIAPRFAERHFGSAEYRTLSPLMRESYKKIVNEDLRGDARKIGNEVFIVEGREDSTTPPEEAEVYLSCLARGRLRETEGGHFAFAEYPVVFNLMAEEFFFHG